MLSFFSSHRDEEGICFEYEFSFAWVGLGMLFATLYCCTLPELPDDFFTLCYFVH